jgi:hypothetical protein
MRLFKLRFSLATLLIVVTATALVLWGVPEWREFQQRMKFERDACQLTIGFEHEKLRKIFQHSDDGRRGWAVWFDADGNAITSVPKVYKRYWYCIYAHTEQLSAEEIRRQQREQFETVLSSTSPGQSLWPITAGARRWTKLYVYRLRPMPPGYEAQSKRGKEQVMRGSDHRLVDRMPEDQYLTDFYEFLAGRESSDFGIEYKLIHVDPPDLTNGQSE